ncbi:sce7726 family protein [Azospirillum formosense]|uniref:sce7726 family protein n=1 Tax=Azospirillum formosense TaxID=861533 RepID=UPI00157A774F|nr:sce7726 family protein [Azospirillum formosense]
MWVSGTPLRDGDIRASLHGWLKRRHAACPDAWLLSELKIPRPSARIDLAVVNGELAGFEIKSDVDSLTRLRRQAESYNGVFDRVYLVTTDRHIKEATTIIPNWWGVALMLHKGHEIEADLIRESGHNCHARADSILYMLHKSELDNIAIRLGLRESFSVRLRHADLVEKLVMCVDVDTLRSEAKTALKQRRTAMHL